MHELRCICEYIPQLNLETKLALVMHKREYPKPTATAPLALEALTNSKLYIQGQVENPLDLSHLNQENRRVLLLFPSESARVLNKEFLQEDSRPVTLVVPDGSWRQAKRMPKRINGLSETEHVVLPSGQPTQWGIRNEPQENGLATFEAIARAMGIIESENVELTLSSLFTTMVETTLETKYNT